MDQYDIESCTAKERHKKKKDKNASRTAQTEEQCDDRCSSTDRTSVIDLLKRYIYERHESARQRAEIKAKLYEACELIKTAAIKADNAAAFQTENKMAALGGVSLEIRKAVNILEDLPGSVRNRNEIKDNRKILEEALIQSSRTTHAVFRDNFVAFTKGLASISMMLRDASRAILEAADV